MSTSPESKIAPRSIADRTGIHPRLGFAGIGWIGMKRLQPLALAGWDGDLVIFDPDPSAVERALEAFPKAKSAASFEELISSDIDAVVISTPSAMHARQVEESLYRDLPVFCQKPLGRNRQETARVVSLAKERNLLLGVDFSYRYTEGIQQIKSCLDREEIGKIYAVEAIFHNAYGPDKEWYYNPDQSGGGCLIDLGSHLIDLIFYLLGDIAPQVVYSNLLAKGERFILGEAVEDFAEAQLVAGDNISIRIACSWKHAVGKDAAIHLKVNGTQGGLEFQNVNGSFYEFRADRYTQNNRITLSSGPDNWEGKALCRWVEELKADDQFDPGCRELVENARLIDGIYSKAKS